jgi:membrane-associated phospholipid phosphatase
MLSFAPLETREIRILYYDRSLPLATYTFSNIPLLQRYFNGMASREQLAPSVSIEYADPAAVREQADRADTLQAFLEPLPESLVLSTSGIDFISLSGQNIAGGRLLVRPSFSTFLNDPSGIFKFDISLIGSYDRPLGSNLFFRAQTNLSLYEDISDAAGESNSDLPHVRTEGPFYAKQRFKLTKLLLNKFYHANERVYARLSGGIYEEMFSGFGGQVLYLGRNGGWGVDVDANWVKQRDFKGFFGHQDYQTITALASLNYRMAKGVTATVRAGRFLAQDEGVRFELKRRFASNWEAGAWFTLTNGNDIQSPGEPGSPYYDKGIYLVWRLNTLLAYDTPATTSLSLSPWTRDVGQMVESPGDLYSILEDTTLQLHYRDGLSRFGDRDDDYNLPSLGTGRDRIWPDFVAGDFFNLGAGARINWMKVGIGAGLLLGSAALDESAFKHFERRKDSRSQHKAVDFGNALPLVALGLSGVFAFDESRPRLSDAGAAALEASALALVATEALKWGVGRARPDAGLGHSEFEAGSSQDRFKSFPSRHTAVMWAAITPYAKEYDMPWLYAVAALTNVARVASREHWVSDTVGGSLLGYALGHLTWAARRESRYGSSGPSLVLSPGSVGLAWNLQ